MRLSGLKHARMRRGWSQAQLAERARLDRGSVSRLETGSRSAQPGTARRLAEALGVEVADLVGDEAEKEAELCSWSGSGISAGITL